MNRTRFGSIAATAVAASIILSSCAANEQQSGTAPDSQAAALSGTLDGIGSSAQGAAETTWISGFQIANPEVTINYDPQGSGAGREAFLSGAADFGGSDAPLKDEELSGAADSCEAGTTPIDLPVYISPIAIAYNVDGLTDLKLDAVTIAGIFKGEITTWDDAAIEAHNPDAPLPDETITVVHRSDDSGTTQNFTEYLSANAPDVWDAAPAQSYPYQIGDAAKGTSGVADALNSSANSIAYIDDSGAGDLARAELKVGESFVTISAEGAADVVAASPVADGREDNDYAIAIDRTNTDENAWPLVLVSYLITCQTYADPAVGKLVSAYASYVVSDEGQQAAAETAGSAPLTGELASNVAAAVDTIK